MLRVLITHPKAGTVMTSNVFYEFCKINYLKFYNNIDDAHIPLDVTNVDIIHYDGKKDDLKYNTAPHLGLHVIRDPRDIIVSSVFYYQQNPSHEHRIFQPRSFWGEKSYSEMLRDSIDFEEKLLHTIKHVEGTMQSLWHWDYNAPQYLNVKFEDLCNYDKYIDTWDKCFQHLEYEGVELQCLKELAISNSIHNGKPKDSHYRSAKPEQYKQFFTEKVTNIFNDQYATLIERLGYEK